jgi:glycosyltransferase involved in cell wall biosynthesis
LRPRARTKLSVVMPVHNNAREIARALTAVNAARSHLSEVIVVDDGSTDGSGEVAARLGARVERLPAHSGAPAARNHGARLASGDVLFFLDADVVAPLSTLERAAALLDQHPEYDAAFGSYDDDPDVPTTVSRFRNLLHHYTHQTGNRESTTFWTGCGLVRKAAFDAVGGLDDKWRGLEDIELGHRLRARGSRILLEPALQVKHLKRWTLTSMVWTDLRYRAFLWSRLILTQEGLPNDLNVRTSQRVSVALSMLAVAMLPLVLLDGRWLAAIAAAAALIVAINREFYSLLRSRGGVLFALLSIPLHIVYFVCAGLGFAFALVESRIFR